MVFGIANSRFIENTETRKLITEIKLKLKYWTQKTKQNLRMGGLLEDAPPCCTEHHHVILRVQRPDGDKEVLLIVR